MNHQALLFVSFGGPDQPDDVMPFLENVLRGRNVPRERMLEVAEHYYHFGGKSPINEQNRALIDAVKDLLESEGPHIPVYFGNRNWHPMLKDTLEQMKQDGITKALAFVTSGFSCYSGCRQYREDIIKAREAVGEGAPEIDKIRVFFNHPGFVEPMADRIRDAFAQIPAERRAQAKMFFTAHSIPMSMSDTSDYLKQLNESCRLVAELAQVPDWRLVYQSRSGPPTQPWLEPDILAVLREAKAQGATDAVVAPIGFISDHMEVLFDLDTEAMQLAEEVGLHLVRAGTVGTDPRFVRMIRDLFLERQGLAEKKALGLYPANHDVCPIDCCPMPQRPATAGGRPHA